MNIAFVTTFDARDVRRGSGTFTFMSREMARQGHTVHYIGPIDYRLPGVSRLLRRLHRLLGRRYVVFLDPFVGRLTGETVGRVLRDFEPDVIVTNDMAVAGFTPTQRPVVIYTDVMITHDYQERRLASARLGGMSALNLFLARRTLRAALKRADLAVFPVQWAADEARHYGARPAATRVIPFGANVDDPGRALSDSRCLAPGRRRFELLFVGKDWARKGGPTAVAVVDALAREGIDATLHIVGCEPPEGRDHPRVLVYGLLDKARPADRDLLYRLYRTSDAFILPSSAEGFVIVALEAAAFGLPTLAYRTIGVTEAVQDGAGGRLLPLGAPAEAFAAIICAWLANPDEYARLARGARDHFERTANWRRAIATLMAEVDVLVEASGA